jgi:hypothetical protein
VSVAFILYGAVVGCAIGMSLVSVLGLGVMAGRCVWAIELLLLLLFVLVADPPTPPLLSTLRFAFFAYNEWSRHAKVETIKYALLIILVVNDCESSP